MGKSNHDEKRQKELQNLKAANLKGKFELEQANKKIREEKEAQLTQYNMKAALKKERMNDDAKSRKQKTAEYAQNIEEAKKHASRYPLQQHNVASLIMEMEPRFANLGKFFTSIQVQLFQEYIGSSFSEWRTEVNRVKVLQKPFTLKHDKPMDVPDLKYFVNVDEQGALKADFVADFIKDFIVKHDEYGNLQRDHQGNTMQDHEKAEIFQQAFQQGIEEWLVSRGYFVQKEGSQYRIYSQDIGKKVNDVWTLKPNEVKKIYDEKDCDYNNILETWIPKPNARPKPGKTPLHMQEAEFTRLKESEADPTKSLGHFLEHHFDGLIFEPSPSPRMM